MVGTAAVEADGRANKGRATGPKPSDSRGKGGSLSDNRCYALKKAAARAGLSAAVSAHWLRHALDRAAPAHLVQATVGHASLATTYAHARPNDSSSR
jgi:integrase/recombinase XerD